MFEFDHGRSRKTQNRGAVVLGILVRDSKVHFRPPASPIFPLSSLLEVNGPLLTVYVTLGREVVINKHVRALSLCYYYGDLPAAILHGIKYSRIAEPP